MDKKFYITTPIYYVNAAPHIGHAYTTVAADVLARYHRMLGEKTFFATGTDEHGAKIEAIAIEKNKDPQAFVDEVAATFEFAWDRLNVSNDKFIRTSNPAHMLAVQKALQYMYDKGDIYLGKYTGYYCRGCEQYKSEKDLVDGLCPDHKKAPEKMEEETYMFKMSKYADELLKKIESNEFVIQPEERRNEMLQFYKNEGLNDVSFSRVNVKWGIPLPWDEKHTAYVWSDAFLNYLTVLGWNGPQDPCPEFWPATVELMSKDILRVHATIWPAMLLSLDLPVPKGLFIHGFFTIDGQKMSKSIGNIIDPNQLVDDFASDAARYLILCQYPFGNDGDIKKEEFITKYNADLANGVGNLVSRVIGMAEKYFDSKVPTATFDAEFDLNKFWEEYNGHFENYRIYEALQSVIIATRWCDNYIATIKPWELAKVNDPKLNSVIYNLLEIIRHLSYAMMPYMPETAEKIWQKLGVIDDKVKTLAELRVIGGLKAETVLDKGEGLFNRKETEQKT